MFRQNCVKKWFNSQPFVSFKPSNFLEMSFFWNKIFVKGIFFENFQKKLRIVNQWISLYLHGILFLAVCLSLQQKHETPQAMTIISITETQPTIKSNFKLIWQFRPANHGRHSQRTLALFPSSKIHFPFLLHKSHSAVEAKKRKIYILFFRIFESNFALFPAPKVVNSFFLMNYSNSFIAALESSVKNSAIYST